MPASFLHACAAATLAYLLRPLYGGIGCILCLHRVVPADERSSFLENRALEITPETLREILEWIRARGLDPIALDAVPERLAHPRRGKFIAFTFDDGYRDNLTHALPIFREFEVPFTVNVTTGFISGNATPWWYALEGLLVARDRLAFRWKDQPCEFRCHGEAARESAFSELAHLIRAAGGQEQRDLLDAIFSAENARQLDYAKSLILNWREVRTLAADPLVSIGAHSVEHHTLANLTLAEAAAEMSDSKRDLEAHFESEIRHFAYPFGGRNAAGLREFALAKKCGFTTAVTTATGNLFPSHASSLHSLPRIGVSGNFYSATTRLRNLESGLVTAAERGRRIV